MANHSTGYSPHKDTHKTSLHNTSCQHNMDHQMISTHHTESIARGGEDVKCVANSFSGSLSGHLVEQYELYQNYIKT